MRKTVFLPVHHLWHKITESVAGSPVQKYRLDYQSCIGFPGIGRKADDTPGFQVIALDIALGVKNPDDIGKAWAKQSDMIADNIADIKNAAKILINQMSTLYL